VIDRETKILFIKELRQLVASKAAVITSAILPIMLLGVLPAVLYNAAQAGPGEAEPLPEGLRFGLMGELASDPRRMPVALLPMLIAMVGLILPNVMASQLLITERERRTLELLVALPVRIEQVLIAKLAAVLTLSCAMTVPLVIAHTIVIPSMDIASLGEVIAFPLLLVCALALATASSLLTALLARDFRTANNVAGLLLSPCIVLTIAGGAVLPPGITRTLVIAAAYLAVAAVMMRVALKTITFERLLS
jgi:ABC-type Na+ efflux pump permease subunit